MTLFKWQTTIIQRSVTFLCGKTALDYAENMYLPTHPYFNYDLGKSLPRYVTYKSFISSRILPHPPRISSACAYNKTTTINKFVHLVEKVLSLKTSLGAGTSTLRNSREQNSIEGFRGCKSKTLFLILFFLCIFR